MKDFIKAIDQLPWIVKLILCIPALDIVWAIYRIVKGIADKDNVLLVIGILWIIPGAPIAWAWDFITTLIDKKPRVRLIF